MQSRNLTDSTEAASDLNEKVPSNAALPDPLIQTERYSAITAMPTDAQINPLRVMIRVAMPREVATIREAVQYRLLRSGYRLIEADLTVLFGLPLPQVHRKLGPMPLDEALRTLAGPAFILSNDPVRRTVSYELADSYRNSIHEEVGAVHE